MNRILAACYLASTPVFLLVLVDVAGLYTFGWNWRVLAVATLTVCLNFALTLALSQRSVWHEFFEVAEFIRQHYDYQFVRASTDEILNFCRSPQRAQEPDPIPMVSRFKNRLRVLSLAHPPGRDPLRHLSSYASTFGAWVFLPWPVSEANGIRRFALLHELGHSSFTAMVFGARLGERTLSLEIQVAAALVLFKVRLDPRVWLPLAALAVVAYGMTCWYERLMQRDALIHDEVTADSYAFARCDRTIFGDEPAEVPATMLCGSDDNASSQLRRRLFITNVSRVREGLRPLVLQDEDLPAYRTKRLAHALAEISKLSLFAFCAVSYAPITNMRLGLLALMVPIVAVWWLFVTLLANVLMGVLDHSLGVREHPELVRMCDSFAGTPNRRTAPFLEMIRCLLSRRNGR